MEKAIDAQWRLCYKYRRLSEFPRYLGCRSDPVTLDPDFLALLACPRCRGGLTPVGAQEGLACESCRLVYPIEEEIPQMLPEKARPLTPSEELP